jgi:transcriptional regulator with GAF, ATPase, and Fis domain
VLDITCRKKASRELELAHEQLETVVEERTAELSTALKEVERLSEHLESENLRLRRQVIQTRNPPDIVGSSSALQKVMHQISQVAQTETSVLLSGETGTGKGLVAGCLHSQSHHADRPLITVDCGTLQPSLIESELFGHEKGAFTGALVARAGWFELADGGTLFLDEIGELPLGAQVKLLRVLQSGEFERLGSTQTRQVNIRIICATNRDLGAMVQDRSFRSDLFFRLSVFPIEIPPLRERIEDLPDLVRFIISKKKRSVGVVNIDDASTEFLERLAQYAWPGNVRELENVVERALILATGRSLEVEDLGGSLGPVNPTAIDPTQSVGSWRENERRFLVKALTASNWKVKGAGNAADRVGIPASTFRDRMNRLGIVKPQAKSISRDQKEESHRPGKSGDSLA